MEKHKPPTADILVLDSPYLDVQREDPDEHIDPFDPMEPIELVERPRDAPPTKWRPS